MGGYAGDSYRVASDRQRLVLGTVWVLFSIAVAAFLVVCALHKVGVLK